jgi:hypothetical protein
MLIVRDMKSPGWSLPLLGGVAFTGLEVVWVTSSYWFFTTTKGALF